MKMSYLNLFLIVCLIIELGCNQRKKIEKGFRVEPEKEQNLDIPTDTMKFITQPGNVLITGLSNVRLIPIYKLNYNPSNKTFFTGENEYYYNYDEHVNVVHNQWHYNLMPGFKTIFGYNLVNFALYNVKEKSQMQVFTDQVLIKNLYYPAFEIDTLHGQPIKRDFFIVTVFDEDTNHDKFINPKDMRKIYCFENNGTLYKEIVPKDHHVFKSQYDQGNDYMLIFAKHDANADGELDPQEAINVFYLDLKNPKNHGMLYNSAYTK